MVTIGPFMEFVKDSITESAANTYTESEFAIPSSKTEDLAMLIWDVWFHPDRPDIEDAQENLVTTQLTKTSQTGAVGLDRDALIAKMMERVSAGGVQGSLSEYFRNIYENPAHWRFDPPVLVAKDTLFLGVVGTGNANAKSARIRIGYTLQKVSVEAFIAALVE